MDNTFSNNIKKLRIGLNLTQKEFAQKIEITPSTMSLYEKGDKKPTLDTLKKIAETFDISLDELCGTKQNNNSITIDLLYILESKKEDELEYLLKSLINEFKCISKIYESDMKSNLKSEILKLWIKELQTKIAN